MQTKHSGKSLVGNHVNNTQYDDILLYDTQHKGVICTLSITAFCKNSRYAESRSSFNVMMCVVNLSVVIVLVVIVLSVGLSKGS